MHFNFSLNLSGFDSPDSFVTNSNFPEAQQSPKGSPRCEEKNLKTQDLRLELFRTTQNSAATSLNQEKKTSPGRPRVQSYSDGYRKTSPEPEAAAIKVRSVSAESLPKLSPKKNQELPQKESPVFKRLKEGSKMQDEILLNTIKEEKGEVNKGFLYRIPPLSISGENFTQYTPQPLNAPRAHFQKQHKDLGKG